MKKYRCFVLIDNDADVCIFTVRVNVSVHGWLTGLADL